MQLFSSYFLNLNEFNTTLTLENTIAAHSIAGFKSIPKKGYKIQAAIGIATEL
ncbi:MAG: hypothetical protein LBQ24_03990 [Candidatus Peribacteria bacterium]|nr:hypothetical protein [Candidatus Peribacteria bacterium]